MATTRKWVMQSSAVTLLSTELGNGTGLAAGSLVLSSSSFNNTQGQANLDGYTQAIVLCALASPSAAFAANSTLDLWFILQAGGTPEYGATGTTAPTRPPDVSFPMPASTTAEPVAYIIPLPPGTFSVLARNNQATGTQALAASGNTVTLQAFTDQGV